ncbi:MAG: hypothetical protein R2719_12030 [Micropruina sp.]
MLRSQGAGFVVLGFVGRLPTAVLPLAMLLYAHHRLGSFALAGLAARRSAWAAPAARARRPLSDRYGHRTVGIAATVGQTAALAGFMLACRPEVPLAPVLGLAGLTGFANPQLGAMARARWSQAAARRPDRAAFTASAMAWEARSTRSRSMLGGTQRATLAAVAAPRLLFAIGLAWAEQVDFALPPTARHQPVTDATGTPPPRPDRPDVPVHSWGDGRRCGPVVQWLAGQHRGLLHAAAAGRPRRLDLGRWPVVAPSWGCSAPGSRPGSLRAPGCGLQVRLRRGDAAAHRGRGRRAWRPPAC